MELINQFQGFLGTIGFGFFFYMLFHCIYKIVKNSSFFIKFPAFLTMFILSTILYYYFLVKHTFGIFNIFYPLSFLIGILFYHYFYFIKFDDFYEKIRLKMDKLIKLKVKKLFAIIDKKKEGNANVTNRKN